MGIELRALHLPSRCGATELNPWLLDFFSCCVICNWNQYAFKKLALKRNSMAKMPARQEGLPKLLFLYPLLT